MGSLGDIAGSLGPAAAGYSQGQLQGLQNSLAQKQIAQENAFRQGDLDVRRSQLTADQKKFEHQQKQDTLAVYGHLHDQAVDDLRNDAIRDTWVRDGSYNSRVDWVQRLGHAIASGDIDAAGAVAGERPGAVAQAANNLGVPHPELPKPAQAAGPTQFGPGAVTQGNEQAIGTATGIQSPTQQVMNAQGPFPGGSAIPMIQDVTRIGQGFDRALSVPTPKELAASEPGGWHPPMAAPGAAPGIPNPFMGADAAGAAGGAGGAGTAAAAPSRAPGIGPGTVFGTGLNLPPQIESQVQQIRQQKEAALSQFNVGPQRPYESNAAFDARRAQAATAAATVEDRFNLAEDRALKPYQDQLAAQASAHEKIMDRQLQREKLKSENQNRIDVANIVAKGQTAGRQLGWTREQDQQARDNAREKHQDFVDAIKPFHDSAMGARPQVMNARTELHQAFEQMIRELDVKTQMAMRSRTGGVGGGGELFGVGLRANTSGTGQTVYTDRNGVVYRDTPSMRAYINALQNYAETASSMNTWEPHNMAEVNVANSDPTPQEQRRMQNLLQQDPSGAAVQKEFMRLRGQNKALAYKWLRVWDSVNPGAPTPHGMTYSMLMGAPDVRGTTFQLPPSAPPPTAPAGAQSAAPAGALPGGAPNTPVPPRQGGYPVASTPEQVGKVDRSSWSGTFGQKFLPQPPAGYHWDKSGPGLFGLGSQPVLRRDDGKLDMGAKAAKLFALQDNLLKKAGYK